jgi:hypothetical protein
MRNYGANHFMKRFLSSFAAYLAAKDWEGIYLVKVSSAGKNCPRLNKKR